MLVQFPEWRPDEADFMNPGAITMSNVVPRTGGSYGPFYAVSATGTQFNNRCQGGIFTRDSDATVFGFAGDVSRLYVKTPGTDWGDVSKTGGYTTPIDETWQFAVFGEQVLATNWSNPIQIYTMGTSTLFADLAAAAPQARYIARVRDFIMVANVADDTDGNRPQRVAWPAIGDPTNWPTAGTVSAAQVQSDHQDLLGDGGWNMGIVGGLSGADVAIVQERAVWRGQYLGPPQIFGFQLIESARGSPAPGSIIAVGPVFYYYGEDGFYVCDGVQSTSIGQNKVDRTIIADIDPLYLHRMTSAVDPKNKIIYWSYASTAATDGTPDKILAYHYGLDRFTLIAQPIETFIKDAMTVGYTLEELDAFGTLETLAYSLDSRAWTGGRPNLACFTTDHKLGLFTGSTLSATLETGEAQLNPNGSAHVTRVWPLVDTTTATVSVGRRDRLADAVTYTSETAMTSTTGSCPLRSTGRYQRARVNIPAGASWSEAQGLRFEHRAAGAR